jgi:hypothetical protein
VFLENFMTLGGSDGPEYRGLREANRVVPSVFLGFVVAWCLTLLPVLPIETKIRGLRRCRVAIWITAAAWLTWTMCDGSSLFR